MPGDKDSGPITMRTEGNPHHYYWLHGDGEVGGRERLAALLGYEFMDLDAVIEAEAGMPIPEIFATHGEGAFRALESRMVERAAARTGCVVATGAVPS
jgi:shikimate kinase